MAIPTISTDDEPQGLTCPITFMIFQDPVVVQSGNTYERAAIQEYWKQVDCLRDPLTNQILSTGALFPNLDKRREVFAFLEGRPGYTPRGWTSSEPPSPQALSLSPPTPRQHRENLHRGHWRGFLPRLEGRLACLLCYAAVALSILTLNYAVKRLIAFVMLGEQYSMDATPWIPSGLLSSLADVGFSVSRQLKMLSFAVEGLQGVIQTMQSNPRDLEVQQQCSQALASLSVRSVNQERIAALGGVELLLQAMRIHAGGRDLQRNCLTAVRNLAYRTENQVTMALLGGIELVLSAMRTYRDDREVAEQSAFALGNLALNIQNAMKISMLGGIEVLLYTMRTHAHSASVQAECSRTLGNLAINYDNHETLVEVGVVQLMMLVMSRHPRADGLHRQCAWTLGNIAVDQHHQEIIASSGGVEQVLATMQLQPHDVETLRECSRTLGNLAMNHDAIRVQIAELGGLHILLRVMEANPLALQLQMQLAWALQNLASNAQNAFAIEELDGIAMLLRIKSHYWSDLQVADQHMRASIDEILKKLPSTEDRHLTPGMTKNASQEGADTPDETHSSLKDLEL